MPAHSGTTRRFVRNGLAEQPIRLAAAVEFKDHDTRAHLWRMSQYSAIVAREMGFDPEWAENLRLAAPMHDIGKIGVPDAVLSKPDRLTTAEYELIKQHPEVGARILEPVPGLADVRRCVVEHHERWASVFAVAPEGFKGPRKSGPTAHQ